MSNITLSTITNTQTTRTNLLPAKSARTTETFTSKSQSTAPHEQKTLTPKENIEKGLKEGTLEYKPGESFLFGLITRKAQYTYQANGKETIAEIRAKFGLEDGALRKTNSYIRDAEWAPEKGRLIYFNEEDLKKE